MRSKDSYPEEGELVTGTVQSIFKQGAFITLDEYDNKRGMLHLSEISLKWVRNIHDYVRVGQKVVLQVLKVDPKRGHIDLSLRRVTDSQRKEKLQEVKYKQRSEKVLSMVAEELGVKYEGVYDKVGGKLVEGYGSAFKGLEAISGDNKIASKLGLNDRWKNKLIEIVSKSIKPSYVEITGYVDLRSYRPDGVEVIKKALSEVESYETENELDVSYISAPIYRIHVKAPDYKTAERVLRSSAERGTEYIKENDGVGEFHRELKEQ